MYTLGRVTVTSGDPFGLFRFTKSFGRPQTVLVYPRPVELTGVHLPPAELLGEGLLHRPTHYVTSNAVSVRQYEFGDSYNRIHWPSTARTRELMVKLFEMDPASDVWIVMDLEAKTQAGSGDESTEEYAVTLAASIANHLCRTSRSVGFMAFGQTPQLIQPERGLAQYVRILESLAVSRATGDVSLAQLLNEEGKRFGRHSTVVVITPSTHEDWVLSLRVAGERGARLAAVLIEPGTFGGERDSLVVFGALAAAGIHTSVVKRAGDLRAALALAIERRRRARALFDSRGRQKMSVLETVHSLDMERSPSAAGRLFPWRDAVTLLIVFAVSMCVVNSIDSAGWVEGMPSLYPIAVFGLAARLPPGAVALASGPSCIRWRSSWGRPASSFRCSP